mmetsp:Transcript_62235/g.167000  ORF Transcript_62235/g.167000 Transcript_62235/m.167000 type:complete len:200 (+) Transcript_62235:897-1496(+)
MLCRLRSGVGWGCVRWHVNGRRPAPGVSIRKHIQNLNSQMDEFFREEGAYNETAHVPTAESGQMDEFAAPKHNDNNLRSAARRQWEPDGYLGGIRHFERISTQRRQGNSSWNFHAAVAEDERTRGPTTAITTFQGQSITETSRNRTSTQTKMLSIDDLMESDGPLAYDDLLGESDPLASSSGSSWLTRPRRSMRFPRRR